MIERYFHCPQLERAINADGSLGGAVDASRSVRFEVTEGSLSNWVNPAKGRPNGNGADVARRRESAILRPWT
jgi:hypothetical protein